VGFCVGPSLVHYRCYQLIRSDTQAVVVSDTVLFHHHTLEIPTLTTKDCIIHCLQALVTAVRLDKTPNSTNKQRLALESLRAILTPSTADQINDDIIPQPNATSPRVATNASSPRVASNTPSPRVAAQLRPGVSPTIPAFASQPIAHWMRAQVDNALADTYQCDKPRHKVSFTLPNHHTDEESTAWR